MFLSLCVCVCAERCDQPAAPEGYEYEYGVTGRTLDVKCAHGFHNPNNKDRPSTQKLDCLDGEWGELRLSCQCVCVFMCVCFSFCVCEMSIEPVV